MVEKVVRKAKLSECNEVEENLKYWLSRTPEERVSAVEELRRQMLGDDPPRLQRVARVIKLSQK